MGTPKGTLEGGRRLRAMYNAWLASGGRDSTRGDHHERSPAPREEQVSRARCRSDQALDGLDQRHGVWPLGDRQHLEMSHSGALEAVDALGDVAQGTAQRRELQELRGTGRLGLPLLAAGEVLNRGAASSKP